MTAVSVVSRHSRRHARPRFPGVRNLVSVRLPKAVNAVWDVVEAYPRPSAVAVVSVVVACALVWYPLAAVLLSVAATALLMRGAYAARVTSLRDKLTEAERRAALAEAHAAAAEVELRRLQRDMDAASMTLRIPLPAVEGGQEDGR